MGAGSPNLGSSVYRLAMRERDQNNARSAPSRAGRALFVSFFVHFRCGSGRLSGNGPTRSLSYAARSRVETLDDIS